MGLIAGVVERLVQPIGMRVLLAWERRESGIAYEERIAFAAGADAGGGHW